MSATSKGWLHDTARWVLEPPPLGWLVVSAILFWLFFSSEDS